MEASPFNILHLVPGRYSRKHIDRQYRTVRRTILRAGGPDRQRRLDDALIAHAMLRNPAGQISLIQRVRRGVTHHRRHRPMTIDSPKRLAAASQVVGPISSNPEACRRFARMVADHVESGILRFTSRRRLVLLAEGLAIGQFKANLIIAEVLHDLQHGRRPAGRDVIEARTEQPRQGGECRYGLRIGLAVAAAIVVDVLLMLWLT